MQLFVAFVILVSAGGAHEDLSETATRAFAKQVATEHERQLGELEAASRSAKTSKERQAAQRGNPGEEIEERSDSRRERSRTESESSQLAIFFEHSSNSGQKALEVSSWHQFRLIAEDGFQFPELDSPDCGRDAEATDCLI